LEKFGVGHREPFLDVRVHLNPGGGECKAKHQVDQRRELHQYIDISKDEPDPKCLICLPIKNLVGL
ncbi:hypothetical protein, partial [Limnohabitans sp. Rim8]|uniref:hypothetical protein n=1 Tax=Limnohabitans sp. Rim8 TaxID=1100718 RepID=UPI0026232837